jgi:hypothetical protein
MVRMHCKSLILQHPLTKCHIITSREMQKIKMNTDTANQNKYNTKNTLASRPNRLKKKKKKKSKPSRPTPAMGLARPTPAVGQASTPTVGMAKPMPAVVWRDRRARRPTGLGLADRDPSRPTYSVAHSETHPQRTSKPTHGETPSTAKTHPQRTSKPHPRRNPIHGKPTVKPTAKPTHRHVETNPHQNPRRNPIHGENYPRRGSRGSLPFHERSLPARRVWPSSLRGSLFFNLFFSSSEQSSALRFRLFWCIFLVFSEVLIRDWVL